ncbi:MAG: dolichyl-phosphate beta-glucosyltransferase [Pedobacter sp.]
MASASKMLSVVIPAYNEEKRLPSSLQVLCGTVGQYFPNFEIIIVDDGSTDSTADIVMSYSTQQSNVRLVRYEKNRGKGYAVRTGVLASTGDLVLFSDADLSTPLGEISKLMAAIDGGADVAIGSRAVKDAVIVKRQPLYRVLMGKTFNKAVQLLATPGISDTQCGFKLFTRTAAVCLFSDCCIDGFGFDVEVLFLARKRGLMISEIGVDWLNSPDSKVHPIIDSSRMLRDLFIIRRHAWMGHYGDFLSVRTKIEASSSE